MCMEAFCTFIFVAANLLVKDERAGKVTANIGEHGVGFLGCAIIALSPQRCGRHAARCRP